MKFAGSSAKKYDAGRSRKGAWIEIVKQNLVNAQKQGRSRKGAWIEIFPNDVRKISSLVAPVRERGLKYT